MLQLQIGQQQLLEYVVIGGGGGGGGSQGGGGGAGAYKEEPQIGAHPVSTTIQIGAGGDGGFGSPNSGGNTKLLELHLTLGTPITAPGGGYGGHGASGHPGGPGGSGGGTGYTGSIGLEQVTTSQEILQILSLQMVGDMMVPLVLYLLTMDLVEEVVAVVLVLLEHLAKVDLAAQVFKFHQHLEIQNLQPH